MTLLPGLAVAAGGLLLASLAHLLVPVVPVLTLCVLAGLVLGQLPFAQGALDRTLKPGLALASRRLLRLGVVLLGLKLSLGDVVDLGGPTLLAVLAVVVLTFLGTLLMGRLARLPGDEPLLLAAGFAICGVSAIGAMAAVTRSKASEVAVPAALVTLCGSLAIGVLPLLRVPLGFTDLQFGAWAGASVHDVGQVVAVAQTAGTGALALAVAIKLSRVVLLAPLVAGVGAYRRYRPAASAVPGGASDAASRPPIVPLFVVGFLVAMLVRTLVPLPEAALAAADLVQTVLFGLALVALGSSIRIVSLVRTSGRSVLVGFASWVLVAALAWGAVELTTG
ncbi:MAG: putative sulfate exporter family transporter [Microbacteriaceae bacterium]|nr:putative sulfate exporter family transporter [Microbacteriaceae bacterium]